MRTELRRELSRSRDNENGTASAEARDVWSIDQPCRFTRARARARVNLLPLAAVEGCQLAGNLRSLSCRSVGRISEWPVTAILKYLQQINAATYEPESCLAQDPCLHGSGVWHDSRATYPQLRKIRLDC